MSEGKLHGWRMTAYAFAVSTCFGIFWGASYINFSNTLFSEGYTTFVETISRGICLFCIALWMGRASGLGNSALRIFMGAWITITLINLVNLPYWEYLFDVAFGTLAGGALCILFVLLKKFPATMVVKQIPLGLALGHVWGILSGCFCDARFVNNVVLVVDALAMLIIGYQFDIFTKVDDVKGLPKRPLCRNLRTELSSLLRDFAAPIGAGALFLILIGAWFRICASLIEKFWFLDFGVGVPCIIVLCIASIILTRRRGRVNLPPLVMGTLTAFLVVLVFSALFWDRAPEVIQVFSGVWLVLLEAILFVSCCLCLEIEADGLRAFCFIQGSVYVCLALGNLAGICAADLGLHDDTFLLMSFLLCIALVIVVVLSGAVRERKCIKSPNASELIGQVKDTSPFQDNRDAALAKLAKECAVTARELEVLRLFSHGRSTRRIAEELVLSEHTVRTHLKRAYAKLDLHSRQDILDAIDEKMQQGS